VWFLTLKNSFEKYCFTKLIFLYIVILAGRAASRNYFTALERVAFDEIFNEHR